MSEGKEENKELEVEMKPRRTRRKSKTPVIWLYATHERIIHRTIARILNPFSDAYTRYRLELGIRLDQLVLPIVVEDRGVRDKLVQSVLDLDDPAVVLLIAGKDKIEDDIEGQPVIADPGETQFYLDTNQRTSYKEAKKRVEELQTLAKEAFQIDPILLR